LKGQVTLGSFGTWAHYRLLQHISSFLGLAVVIATLWAGRAPTAPGDDGARRQIALYSILGGGAFALQLLASELSQRSLWAMRGDLVVATLSGSMFGLCLACALDWHERPPGAC
jgi:hypothetical protein